MFLMQGFLKLIGKVCWSCPSWKGTMWNSLTGLVVPASKYLSHFRQVHALSDHTLDCPIELMLAFCFPPSTRSHSFSGSGSDCYHPLQTQLDCLVWCFLMSLWFLKESDLFLLFTVCYGSACHLWLSSYLTYFFLIRQFISVIFVDFEVFGPNLTGENSPCTNFILLMLVWNLTVKGQWLTLFPKVVMPSLAQTHHE